MVSGRGKSKACEATFIEQKTRFFYWTVSMLDRSTESMELAITNFVTTFDNKKVVLSFIVDRGKKFSCWEKIENDLEVPKYFCDSHSLWQREGANENGNGLFRKFSTKVTDFSKVSEQ